MARVLLIDDEEQLRSSLVRALAAEGHEVHAAIDGRDGERLARERRPDIVVTDLFMPDKDGLEMIRELRRAYPDLQIIAMSGGFRGGRVDLLPVARKLGATLTLQKPFEPVELISAIRLLLD